VDEFLPSESLVAACCVCADDVGFQGSWRTSLRGLVAAWGAVCLALTAEPASAFSPPPLLPRRSPGGASRRLASWPAARFSTHARPHAPGRGLQGGVQGAGHNSEDGGEERAGGKPQPARRPSWSLLMLQVKAWWVALQRRVLLWIVGWLPLTGARQGCARVAIGALGAAIPAGACLAA